MAGKKIGAGISLDGEKEFKQAVSEINGSLNVLKSELKKVSSEYLDNKNSAEALNAQQEVINKQIEAQTKKVDVLKAALENAKKEYGENSKQVQSWQIKLNNAESDLNKMNKELADVENQAEGIDKVNDELEKTAKQTEEASAGTSKFNNSMSKIGSVASAGAAVATAAIAAIGTAVTAVAVQLSKLTVETAAYADEIITTSTVTGMSTESLQAYSYAADLVDVSTETLTGSMSKQLKSMSSAASGSKAYAEAYDTLKVSVTDSNNALRDSEEVYWETIDALGKIENETERDALAMQIFGKSAQELNPLIAQGSEGIRELTEEAKQMGAVLSEDTLNSLGSFDDSIQRLTAGGKAAKNALGTLLLPQLQVLADEGVSLLGAFTNGFLEANGDWDKIGALISSTIESVLGSVVDKLPRILDVGGDIVIGLVSGIINELPEVLNASFSIIGKLIEGIADTLPTLFDGTSGIVPQMIEVLNDQIPEIIVSGVYLITELITGIAESLPTLIPAMMDVIDTLVTSLTDPWALGQILNAALLLLTELAFGLVDAIPALVGSVITVIENLVTFILDPENLAKIINAALKIVIALGSGLVSAIPQLYSSVISLISSIITQFRETDWGSVGRNIVDGLLDGLKSSWDSLKRWFTTSFENLKQSVKDLFDINSPSRWAKEEIMGNVMRGFGLGIEENAEYVKSQMNAVTSSLINDVEYDFNANIIASQITASEIPSSMLSATYSQVELQPATVSQNDKFDRMLALLEIIAVNSKKEILLDRDTLVGELIDNFDTGLGNAYVLKKRGV